MRMLIVNCNLILVIWTFWAFAGEAFTSIRTSSHSRRCGAPASTTFHNNNNKNDRTARLPSTHHLSTSQQQPSSSSSSSSTSFSHTTRRLCRARDLVQSLIEEHECFTTETGARALGQVCAANIVYEDRFEPQPIVGRTAVTEHWIQRARQRPSPKAGFRLDKMSDGDLACGFAWTWTCGNQEGLRCTTFVQLNSETGLIEYVQEIREPIVKPGDFTKDLLRMVTAGAVPKPVQPFERQTPTTASALARYLFVDLQNADPVEARQELMRFLDDQIVYRDFNYEHVLRGPEQVRQFVEDFTFPGIEFRLLRVDDGVDRTCFTWEVVLDDAPDTIHGISFYELDPESRKIVYVRDVPESAIKPPILGTLACRLRPGLGVFWGVPLGSRPGGL